MQNLFCGKVVLQQAWSERVKKVEIMKIEEIIYSSPTTTHTSLGGAYLPYRMLAKRILVVACAALLCVGSYYFGHESNEVEMNNLEENLNVIQSSFDELHRLQRDLTSQFDLQHHVEKRQSGRQVVERRNDSLDSDVLLPESGAAFIRWGRRDCTTDATATTTIYKGIAAGAYYSHIGGGSNLLCADMNVTYTPGRYSSGNSGSSYFYGVQYAESWSYSLMDMTDIEGRAYVHYDVPCAACMSAGRSSQMMIPGRETCPSGWTKEYSGYIFGAAHGNAHTTDYVCIDEKPQIVPGSDGDQGGGYLYMVETQCPSFQCGPYVHGRELRCVVCTI